MDSLQEVWVNCPVCWESVCVEVDVSAGASQAYTEDCPVCCNPMRIAVYLDGEGMPVVTAEPGNG